MRKASVFGKKKYIYMCVYMYICNFIHPKHIARLK